MVVAPTPGAETQADNPDLVLRFGDVTPKRETIIIGEKEFSAYVWNKRVPRTIRAMVFDAYREARDDSGRLRSQLANESAINKAMMAMIPGLTYSEIDAFEPDEVEKLEIRLGLRPDPNAKAEVQKETENPPMDVAIPTRPTGAKSSSASRRPGRR